MRHLHRSLLDARGRADLDPLIVTEGVRPIIQREPQPPRYTIFGAKRAEPHAHADDRFGLVIGPRCRLFAENQTSAYEQREYCFQSSFALEAALCGIPLCT